MSRRRALASDEYRRGAVPDGPAVRDDAHEGTFSEILPPETVRVDDQRVFLYDATGRPLTRKVGFR